MVSERIMQLKGIIATRRTILKSEGRLGAKRGGLKLEKRSKFKGEARWWLKCRKI